MKYSDFVKNGTISELFDLNTDTFNTFLGFILHAFEECNPTVDYDEENINVYGTNDAPALFGIWLKINTYQNYGWLHVYFNKDTRQIEWY